MPDTPLNYDHLASQYDERYGSPQETGIAAALQSLAASYASPHVLEVGCGTGHWLQGLSALPGRYTGLDPSAGMLRQAQAKHLRAALVRGVGEDLPFRAEIFDLLICVNAIHHMLRPRQFLWHASRLLRPGGRLAIVSSNPHQGSDQWYVFRCFPETFHRDLERFPRWEVVREWVESTGLGEISLAEVERYRATYAGHGVFADPFLKPESCSQLAMLSEQEYQHGLERIRSEIQAAEARGETALFVEDMPMLMLVGQKP